MPDNTILAGYIGSGASEQTAAQDGLALGPLASQTMANTDLPRVIPIKARFNAAAAMYNLPPAVLAAIASREKCCGNDLQNGYGDGGRAFGIMQVDCGSHLAKYQKEAAFSRVVKRKTSFQTFSKSSAGI